jgi:hypothetical protein
VRRPSLTSDQVHEIRTAGLSDAHWERLLGVTRTCVQKARVGVTWVTHPTPPDTVPRAHTGCRGGRPETVSVPQMSMAERVVSVLLAKWPRGEA